MIVQVQDFFKDVTAQCNVLNIRHWVLCLEFWKMTSRFWK